MTVPKKIAYSPLALSDLDDIWENVTAVSGSLKVAGSVLDAIQDRVDLLGAFPLSGTPIESLYDIAPGYRLVSAKGYIAFYRVCVDKVCVDRVLSARCDYLAVLFGDKGTLDM